MPRFSMTHVLQASAALEEGDNYTSGFNVGELLEAVILINVTARSGTSPTLDTVLQTSPDNSTWFDMADSFTQLTDVAKLLVKITNFGKFIRLKLTVGGTNTPTMTTAVYLAGKD